MIFKWYLIIPPHSRLFSVRPPSLSFHDTWVGLWYDVSTLVVSMVVQIGGYANNIPKIQKWIQEWFKIKHVEKERLNWDFACSGMFFVFSICQMFFSQIEHVTCLRISKLLLKEMPIDNTLLCDNKHHHMTTRIQTSYSKNHGAVQNVSIKDAPSCANRTFYTKHHRTIHGREETFFSMLFEDPLPAGLTTTLDYFKWTSYQHFGQMLTKHFAVASFRDSFSATRRQLSSWSSRTSSDCGRIHVTESMAQSGFRVPGVDSIPSDFPK